MRGRAGAGALAHWVQGNQVHISFMAAMSALACMLLPAPGFSAPLRTQFEAGQPARAKLHIGNWRLAVSRDAFSGDIRCRLRSTDGHMVYQANALGFRLGKHRNVTDAWIRIDAGAPIRWRDMLPELARLRVSIDGRDMVSPTNGVVWIPAPLLGEARDVAIQRARGKKPRRFAVSDFRHALEQAKAMGCTPGERFVP